MPDSPVLNFFAIIFAPIIWFMEKLLEFYTSVSSSPGLGIIALAVTMTLICWPLQRYGKTVEDKIGKKISDVDLELAPFKAKLKGEALFKETERIYKKHKYHPIQLMGMSMSFFVILPILISAIILLSSHELLVGKSFLLVSDLSQSDKLLGTLNLLPILMTGITIFDAFYRFKDDKKSRNRFLIIAFVLFALVYSLPAALIVYWTTNVTLSMLLSLRKKSAEA